MERVPALSQQRSRFRLRRTVGVDLDKNPFGPTRDMNIFVHPAAHACRGGRIVGGDASVLDAQGHACGARMQS